MRMMVSLCLALSACTPTYFVRPGATQDQAMVDNAQCELAAYLTPQPYQVQVAPFYDDYEGRHHHYGRHSYGNQSPWSTLIGVMLARWTQRVWVEEKREECLLAMGYQEVR